MSNEIERQATQVATGWEPVLRVAYEDVFNTKPLFSLLESFSEHCPTVDLSLSVERLNGCLDAILDNRVDIALGYFSQFPPISEFTIKSLGWLEFVFVVAKHHPLAKSKKPLTPEIIKNYATIYSSDTAHRLPALEFGFRTDKQRLTFPSMEMKKQAHIQGLGIGFMPTNLIADDIKAGRLLVKETVMDNPNNEYHLVWRNKAIGNAGHWLLEAVQKKQFIKLLGCRTSIS